MKARRIKFIPENPEEEIFYDFDEDSELTNSQKIIKYGLDGFFEFWGMQTTIRSQIINDRQMDIYISDIYGLARDLDGNIFYCNPENIKFMND